MSKNNNTQFLEAQFATLSVKDDHNNTMINNNNNTGNTPAVVVGDDVQSLQRSKYNIAHAYNSVPEDFNLIKECSSFHPLESLTKDLSSTAHPYSLDLSDPQDDLYNIQEKNKNRDLHALVSDMNLSANSATHRQESMPYCK